MELPDRLALSFLRSHPEEAVEVLIKLPLAEACSYLQTVGPVLAATAIGKMPPRSGSRILESLPSSEASSILEKMNPHEGATVLRTIKNPDVVDRLLETVPVKKRKLIRSLLRFPAHLIGAVMEPVEWFFGMELTAGDVVERLKLGQAGLGRYLYVTDGRQKLVGVLSLKEIVRADRSVRIRDIMKREMMFLSAYRTLANTLDHPELKKFSELPVVEKDGVLLGILRYSDLVTNLDGAANSEDDPDYFEVAFGLLELFFTTLFEFFRMTAGSEKGRAGRHS